MHRGASTLDTVTQIRGDAARSAGLAVYGIIVPAPAILAILSIGGLVVFGRRKK